MDYISKYLTPEIKLSSYDDELFKSDLMFDDHMLIWFISGETKIIQADATFYFKTGDIFLIPRNLLAAMVNYPKNGQPHKTVVMHLSTERLKKFYEKINIDKKTETAHKIFSFSNHPLIESCMASVVPYFDMKGELPDSIASLKITEAISILREIDKSVDNVLANFDEPGKVDLIDFMERNFMYNMPMEKLGYLTGRSLSTFNRDFKKYFNMPPQKWLTEKRLQMAHFLLSDKRKKPAEVYLEVGFEDFSHFSFAFKKKYGFSPSQTPLLDSD
ncbi:helix-turn-helix domain-containing protein [Flavobacterium sp.]|uniref:helix-turn-helix domain-containing protein n=1 Tax=Flavobacterium sp. TaxID=239 RepID=UPI003D0C1603